MESLYQEIIAEIPKYLQQYIVDQNYQRYTSRDHALWRYIMRRNLAFLKQHAHSSYLNGLEKTGISIDRIPHIDDMNKSLSTIGWKAVIVDGFLPPAVFMEFQFHKILVISADMRSLQHVLYTPAPDIVHEAAGHAPIIADEEYAEFLQKFGEYGMKAFSSKLDNEIYEAIRHLSIIKEYPDTSKEELEKAEKNLNAKIALNTDPSEMTKLSRLHWWTVEYGLIGTPESYKLYGAGLLSSVGESKNCLNPSVKKLPLSVECTNYNYDITKEQPQLFVNKDWGHLLNVLEEFSDSLSFRTGGNKAIETAIASHSAATCNLSSGLQISGVFSRLLKDQDNNPSYLKTTGPTSLAYNNKQISGHGIDYHADGFGSPIGVINNLKKPLEELSNSEMKQFGFEKGKNVSVEFTSGIVVKGKLINFIRKNGGLQILTFDNCKVIGPNAEELFNPSWGLFDMAVGLSFDSVFSGTADKQKHNVYPPKSKQIAIPIKYSQKDLSKFKAYSEIRNLRTDNTIDSKKLKSLWDRLEQNDLTEWLINLEMLELSQLKKDMNLVNKIKTELQILVNQSEEQKDIIESGLTLLDG